MTLNKQIARRDLLLFNERLSLCGRLAKNTSKLQLIEVSSRNSYGRGYARVRENWFPASGTGNPFEREAGVSLRRRNLAK